MERTPKYRIKHIGFNADDESGAKEAAEYMRMLFNFEELEEFKGGVFVDRSFEFMKGTGRGTHGHIALYTEDIELAMEDLSRKGITFREDSIRYKEDGKIRLVYFEKELFGFAIHLSCLTGNP